MKVTALKECFVGGRRRKGAVFDYVLKDGEKLPPFLARVGEDVPERAAEPVQSEPPTPVALSELAKTKPALEGEPETLSALNNADQDLTFLD